MVLCGRGQPPPHTQPAWKGIKPLHSGLEGLGGCGDFKRAVGI